jgi:hypothetical protein
MSSPQYTDVEIQAAQRAAKRARAIQQIDRELVNIEAVIRSRNQRKQTLLRRRAVLQERLDQNIGAITNLKRAAVPEVPDLG